MTRALFVTGTGTDVGKTVVSALLVKALGADYWKPVQSGDLHFTDADKVRTWTGGGVRIHPETYRLHTPVSPHAAAAIDGISIDLDAFRLPDTDCFIITEGAGGLFVPLNDRHCVIDLIEHLGLPVVLVSRHYLGSINHTLLSIEALRARRIPIAALIFNGPANPATEQAIQQMGGIAPLFRLDDLEEVGEEVIAREAERLKELIVKRYSLFVTR